MDLKQKCLHKKQKATIISISSWSVGLTAEGLIWPKNQFWCTWYIFKMFLWSKRFWVSCSLLGKVLFFFPKQFWHIYLPRITKYYHVSQWIVFISVALAYLFEHFWSSEDTFPKTAHSCSETLDIKNTFLHQRMLLLTKWQIPWTLCKL